MGNWIIRKCIHLPSRRYTSHCLWKNCLCEFWQSHFDDIFYIVEPNIWCSFVKFFKKPRCTVWRFNLKILFFVNILNVVHQFFFLFISQKYPFHSTDFFRHPKYNIYIKKEIIFLSKKYICLYFLSWNGIRF